MLTKLFHTYIPTRRSGNRFDTEELVFLCFTKVYQWWINIEISPFCCESQPNQLKVGEVGIKSRSLQLIKRVRTLCNMPLNIVRAFEPTNQFLWTRIRFIHHLTVKNSVEFDSSIPFYHVRNISTSFCKY